MLPTWMNSTGVDASVVPMGVRTWQRVTLRGLARYSADTGGRAVNFAARNS
jgi:hypothetical protein